MIKMEMNLYKMVRPHMKTGDLIETASSTAIGWLIRKVTKKDVNHSALIVRPTEVVDRVYLAEALNKGIELNLMSRYLGKYKGIVYWYKLKKEYDENRPKILREALDICSVEPKYDYFNLFRNIFGRISMDGRRYFCSEFYQDVLTKANVIEMSKEASRPGEFFKLGVHEKRIKIHPNI